MQEDGDDLIGEDERSPEGASHSLGRVRRNGFRWYIVGQVLKTGWRVTKQRMHACVWGGDRGEVGNKNTE